MNTPPKYKSPGALKAAFEHRHRGEPARALVLIMQRFAARVCRHCEGAVIKGGLGLELRLEQPRTTKDADMIISGSHDLDRRLEAAGKLDLGDFLRFEVTPDKQANRFQVPGMAYPGRRHTVQAFFTDRAPLPTQAPYRRFSTEISVGEAAAYDEFTSSWPGFEQVHVVPIRVYDIHWQLAEKLHAYTDPRHRATLNKDMWRPRDLIDFCRCASSQKLEIDAVKLRHALEQTFQRRRQLDPTLPELPGQLPGLPDAWQSSFALIIAEAGLQWTVTEAHELAAGLLDPVLGDRRRGRWSPSTGWLDAD